LERDGENETARREGTGSGLPDITMRLIAFALGLFAFVGIFLLVLKYTTYLSNLKKGVQRPVSADPGRVDVHAEGAASGRD
jgi:hypothetical protein